MKIKLLRDQQWSVGFFQAGTILELGVNIKDSIGKDMLRLGYAEELGSAKPSAAPENKAIVPPEENKFKAELIEKIQTMTKKELISYSSKNKIELSKEDNLKSEILEKVLKFMQGGK